MHSGTAPARRQSGTTRLYTAIQENTAHPGHGPGRSAQYVPQAIRAGILKRIKAVPVNRTRFGIPADLQLACHKKLAARKDAKWTFGMCRRYLPSPCGQTYRESQSTGI